MTPQQKREFEQTMRQRLAKMARDLVEQAGDSFEAPAIADKVVEHVKLDPVLMSDVVSWLLPVAAYEMVIRVLSTSRRDILRLNGQLYHRQQLLKRLDVFESRTAKFTVHCSRGHVHLLKATTRDLDENIAERMTRANSEMLEAEFLRRIRARLTGQDLVEQHWTERELAELRIDIFAQEDGTESN